MSGKGAYFLNGKYARVSNFNFAKDFSISVWVKPDNADNNLYGNILVKSNVIYLCNGGSSNNYFYVAIYNKNTSSWQYITTTDLLPIDKYTHIVVVKNGTNLKIFYDASIKKSATIVEDVANNNQSLNISYSNNVRPQSYDDLLIFNRALSKTEVQTLYQNKANTPKYFPTPTNEIKEGSLELATSGAVYTALQEIKNTRISITNHKDYIYLYKYGKVVFFSLNSDWTGLDTGYTYNLATIPEGYKPVKTVKLKEATVGVDVIIQILTEGHVLCYNYGSAFNYDRNGQYYGCWITN